MTDARKQKNPHPFAGRLAAPSCVISGTVAENARFLNGRTDEVALCFFETQSCLAYTEADLPPELARLPLRFHVHLPVDLPWPTRAYGAGDIHETADLALAVCDKAAYLRPRLAVLHPPEGDAALKRRLLEQFAARWHDKSAVPLLLENVAHCDIAELGDGFLHDQNLGLCLDVGHLMGYKQNCLLDSKLPETAVLVHWSAPGKQDQHLPLTDFSASEYRTAAGIMRRFPGTATHLTEIFHWSGAAASLPVLAALLTGKLKGISDAHP
jgi:hypothetical protein